MKNKKTLFAVLLILSLFITAGTAGLILPDPAELEARRHFSLLQDALEGKGEDALWQAVDEMSDEALLALIAEGSAYYQSRGESWGIEGFVPIAAERIAPKINPSALEEVLMTADYTVEFRQLILELAFYAQPNNEEFGKTVKALLKDQANELPEVLVRRMILVTDWDAEQDWALLNSLFADETLPDARRRALRVMANEDPAAVKPLLYKMLDQPGQITPEMFGTTCIVISDVGERYPEIYSDAPKRMLEAAEKVLQDPSIVGADKVGLTVNTTATLCHAFEQEGLLPLLMTYRENIDALNSATANMERFMRSFSDELSFEVNHLLASKDVTQVAWAMEWVEHSPKELYQDNLKRLAEEDALFGARASAVMKEIEEGKNFADKLS